MFLCIVDEVENKARYLLLKGKALNVLPSHNEEAHDLLSKAVKLDPRLAEAWVQLGESYWKNRDVDGAKNCFIGALSHVCTALDSAQDLHHCIFTH